MVRKFEDLKVAEKVWDVIFGMEYDIESMDKLRKKEGVHYQVTRHGDGHWTCSCESWKYKTGVENVRLDDIEGKPVLKQTCKHIRFILKKEGIAYTVIYKYV